MPVTKKDLGEAAACVTSARAAVRVCQEAYDALRRQHYLELYGIQPGVYVRSTKGVRYLVLKVEVNSCWGDDKPWLKGALIKKDGTPGNVAHTVFVWEICT